MNHKRWKLDHQSCLRNVQSCSGGKKLLVSKLEKKVANSTIKTCPTPVCVIIMYIIVYSYTCLLLLITDVERKKIIIQTHFAFDERSFLFVITFYSVDFSSYCAEEISCLTGFLPLNNFSVTRAIDSRVGKQLLRSITLTPFWI